jgi:RNA polymerase sigma factor (sigma-70 family)
MHNKDEQIHIAKILQGDSSAYRFLVEQNKKIVYSVALRILNNAEDAEDAAQESFIRAYNQLHTFKAQSKFSTWLCTITYRICVSRLKKNSLESNIIDDGIVENYEGGINTPYKELTEKEKQLIIKRAIQKLPPIDALLITLYYFNENSITELGEITSLTASNIKIKLFRARKILEQELKFLM